MHSDDALRNVRTLMQQQLSLASGGHSVGASHSYLLVRRLLPVWSAAALCTCVCDVCRYGLCDYTLICRPPSRCRRSFRFKPINQSTPFSLSLTLLNPLVTYICCLLSRRTNPSPAAAADGISCNSTHRLIGCMRERDR